MRNQPLWLAALGTWGVCQRTSEPRLSDAHCHRFPKLHGGAGKLGFCLFAFFLFSWKEYQKDTDMCPVLAMRLRGGR